MHDVRCSRCGNLLCTEESGVVTIKYRSEVSFIPAGSIKAKCGKCGKISSIHVELKESNDIYAGAKGVTGS